MKKEEAVEAVEVIITNLEGIASNKRIAETVVDELEDLGMLPPAYNKPTLEADINPVHEWEQ